MHKKVDYTFIGSLLLLLFFSIFFIYSSSISIDGDLRSQAYKRQLIFLILGIGFFILIQFISLKRIKQYSMAVYIILLVLLLVTLMFGEVRNGAKSWLGISNFGIQISEFMKLGLILVTAKILGDGQKERVSGRTFIQSLILLCIPMILILLQPDMGTALVYVPIYLVTLYVFGIPGKRVFFIVLVGIVTILTLISVYFLFSKDIAELETVSFIMRVKNVFILYVSVVLVLLILSYLGFASSIFRPFFQIAKYCFSALFIGSILAFLAIIFLKPYQLQRLLIVINPGSDAQNTGWHILQSINAIGSGGITGLGYLNGSQSKLQYLPMAQTDFIFSVIGEEFGFLGAFCVVMLYTLLMWRILIIGSRSKNMYNSICCGGVFALMFTHFTVNVGMTLGFMPVTGIPLLLLSYGGSSLWTTLLSLGLVHSIYRNEQYNRNER